MHRLIPLLALMLAPLPASAQSWTFQSVQFCALKSRQGGTFVEVTFDRSRALPFELSITSAEGWPRAEFFSIAFSGEQNTNVTTRDHKVSRDGRTITVKSLGIPSIANGLLYDDVALASTGGRNVTFSTERARGRASQFLSCATTPRGGVGGG